MARHKFVKNQAAKQREDNCAEKTFPCFFSTDVRHHQMPPYHAARQVRAHVRKLGDCDQIQHVELAGEVTVARTRSEIHNFGDEIEKPKHVEQTEECVCHGLQRLIIPKPGKHLPPEHRQQKEKQDRDFKIV